MSDNVLVTCRQMQESMPEFAHEFSTHRIDVRCPTLDGQQLTEERLIELLQDVDGVIAGDDPFTARVIAQAPRLRAIAKWGIGMDGIDSTEAAARGIRVSNTPGVFDDDVADVAAGYLVVLARQLHRIHASVVEGGWLKVRGVALSGRTLGILGFGHIGRAVARRAAGFGMDVIAYDVSESVAPNARSVGVELVDLDTLFRRAEFLTLCAPLTATSRRVVNRRTLGMMNDGSYIVNVSRGGLIDEGELIEALQSGRIAGAALDVFESEPLPSSSPLRAHPQCVFGSHNGSNTVEGTWRASYQAVTNLLTDLGYEATLATR
jgi:D-3-phosphoglycerate dehydrogenase / 2-oxoglutarate reductase